MPAFISSTFVCGWHVEVDTEYRSYQYHFAQGSLNVGYTLDLWQRLANTADAAEWSHKATAEDMESARLSLITLCDNNLLSNYVFK